MHLSFRRPATRLVAFLALLMGVAVMSVPAAQAAYDRDCGDFANQRDAQIFFLNAGGPSSDPHRLDSEGDGVACESLPCPCYYGTSAPSAGPKPTPSPAPEPKPEKKTQIHQARVVKVLDGDTVDVRIAGGPKVRVRLLGVDTPEVFGGVECGGRAASRFVKRNLRKGTRVRLVSDTSQANKDRYGRWLRYVTRSKDAKDISRWIVRRGHGTVLVVGGKPFKRVGVYRAAQKVAKRHHLGMWGAC